MDLASHRDERGFFARSFCVDEFAAAWLNNQEKDGPLRGAMPGMKLGAGRGLCVVCRGFAG